VVVADAHSGGLFYRRQESGEWKQFGRRGHGPGEFHHVSWIGRCRTNEVFAMDIMRRLMIVYDSVGRFLREFALPVDRDRGAPISLACFDSGVFVRQGTPIVTSTGKNDVGVIRGKAPVLVTTQTDVVGRVDDVASGEFVVLQGGASPRPLGKRTSLAVSSDRVFIGSADSDTIDVHSLSGVKVGTILLRNGKPRAPTAANIVAANGIILSEVASTVRVRVEDLLNSVPTVAALPPYFNIQLDPRGYLWILCSAPGDSTTTFELFEQTGKYLGTVRINESMTVSEIGEDYLLGYRRGDADVPEIITVVIRR
jgi:hypothetical protein